MRVGNGDLYWEGPELAGPDSRRLLRVYGSVVGESGVADALAANQAQGAMYRLAGHPRGVAMLLDVLKGWTRDGVDVSRDMLNNIEDPMEPWAVLLEVLMVSGFFGPGQKAKMMAILKAVEAKRKRETPTSE